MALFTLITRATDGLPLVASTDSVPASGSIDTYKAQAKAIVKKLDPRSPSKMSIESGGYVFSYMMEDGIVFLVLTERSYPKRLAFAYLADVAAGMREALVGEYGENWRPALDTLAKPFAFLSVDSRVIQRLKKEYADPSSKSNASKLSEELAEVQGIMRRNIQEVLERGEKLEHVSKISSRLVSESKRFKWGAKRLNTLDFYKRLAPWLLTGALVAGVMYWRFF